MFARIFRISGVIAILYVGFVLLIAGCQRQMIYFPATGSEGRLMEVAQSQGLEPWRSAEGELVGWRTPLARAPEGVQAVVVFHGNAGYALHRDYFVRGFGALPGDSEWRVHLFEYPGYGARSGRASASVFKEAAEQALGELIAAEPASILLVGESLGSGVASHLAAHFPGDIDGLILITPFTSLKDVAQHHFPFLPVRLLLRENYDNVEALRAYNGPVAMILAEDDDVIPTQFGQRLFDSYEGPKRLWIQPGRGHNTLDYAPSAGWWQEVVEFLQASSD